MSLANMDDEYRVNPADREMIIGTMRRWLDGEPVWSHDEIVQRWGREFLMYRIGWNMNLPMVPRNVDRSIALYKLRNESISEFGFTIPSRELLDVLERHQPIVEIGAGTGYLTKLMRNRGIDVIGTDAHNGTDKYKFRVGVHDPQQIKVEGKSAVRRFCDRTVFCAWPSLWETWFRQALRAMRIGQHLVVVEEDACAEDSAWEYRDRSFEMVGDLIPLPAWPNLNDRAHCFVKRRHAVMRPPKTEEETRRREESWNAAKKLVTEEQK